MIELSAVTHRFDTQRSRQRAANVLENISLKIADGESYQFALAGALSKPRVLVKLVPAGDSSVASAKYLADSGCRNQAVTMLEAIAAAGER